MRLLALSLVVTLGACGGTSKPAPAPAPAPTTDPVVAAPAPTPSDAELDAIFARSLDFFDDLAEVSDAHAADCAALAAGFDRVFTEHQAVLADGKRYQGNAEVDAKADAYMAAHQDRAERAQQRIGTGLKACKDDPAVQAVMARFDE